MLSTLIHKFVNCASISAFIPDQMFKSSILHTRGLLPSQQMPLPTAALQSVLSFHRD